MPIRVMIRARVRVRVRVRVRLSRIRARLGGGVGGSVPVGTQDSVHCTCIELQLSHATTSYPYLSYTFIIQAL